jgi:hypothetical protein
MGQIEAYVIGVSVSDMNQVGRVTFFGSRHNSALEETIFKPRIALIHTQNNVFHENNVIFSRSR